jgi:hypothetical protein
MFRASRGDVTGSDRFFAIKALLFVVGASLGIAGMVTETGWLVWIAISVLAVAIVVRLIGSRRTD